MGSSKCPNCGREPNWINLNAISDGYLPMGYQHWECQDCFHTWFDAQGPGEELKEENIKLFKEWDRKLQEREKVLGERSDGMTTRGSARSTK